MRSKAPLALMEQMVMLLVFALAAALCLQAFVKSDAVSGRAEARDRASVLVQSTAETIRHYGDGDMGSALSRAAEELGAGYQQGILWLDYDEDWNPDPAGPYRLTAQGVPTDIPGLWKVQVAVTEGQTEPEVLFELEAAWQGEVNTDGC